nr:hypothetical protein [Paenibacillus peoriae]
MHCLGPRREFLHGKSAFDQANHHLYLPGWQSGNFRTALILSRLRYVKVTGVPQDQMLEQFIGYVIHTDLEQTGSF